MKKAPRSFTNWAAAVLALFVLLLGVFPSAKAFASDDTKGFIGHFYDDANVPDYVAKIDVLIDAAEAKIYPSMEVEEKDGQLPRTKTKDGILMLYTVTHTKDGVLLHFSTSRAPYLPTPLGKHIIGLFMVRSGWPKPAMFSISKDQIFHAIWVVPDSQFTQIQRALPAIRTKIRNSEAPKEAFLRGLLRSRDLEQESKP